MKRSLAALIGSASGLIIFVIADLIFRPPIVTAEPATSQPHAPNQYGWLLLFVLTPLIAGSIAGILAARHAEYGGRRGALAGVLTALFLPIPQIVVIEICNTTPAGNVPPPFSIIVAAIEFMIFVTGLVISIVCNFALAPAVGAIAGAITARVTRKRQLQPQEARPQNE